MKLQALLEHEAAVGQDASSVLQRWFRERRHIDSLLCCRHNMKLRTTLEHLAAVGQDVSRLLQRWFREQ